MFWCTSYIFHVQPPAPSMAQTDPTCTQTERTAAQPLAESGEPKSPRDTGHGASGLGCVVLLDCSRCCHFAMGGGGGGSNALERPYTVGGGGVIPYPLDPSAGTIRGH